MMKILILSSQRILVNAFVSYAKAIDKKITITEKADKSALKPDIILIDAAFSQGKKNREQINRYKDHPVFIMNINKKKKSLFGVNNITGVFEDNTPIDEIIKIISIFDNRAKEDSLYNMLSITEQIILESLGKGLPDKAIARDNNLTLTMVKYHVRGLYKKLGVSNRTQAALKAQEITL